VSFIELIALTLVAWGSMLSTGTAKKVWHRVQIARTEPYSDWLGNGSPP
jgi:hypothetical protein